MEARRSNAIGVNVINAWVIGYMSAYNFYAWKPNTTMNQIVIPDRPTILAYLDKHCMVNPLEDVFRGAAALVADLGGFRPPFSKKQ